MTPTRRHLMQSFAAAGGTALLPRLAFADAATERRFVLLILRGAMDGLSVLPPVGDPEFLRQRGPLGEVAATAIPLDGFFALHPALAPLQRHWQAGHLLPVHALASPHRGRSHFEAQDVLESAVANPHSGVTGWLNRLAGLLDGRGDGGKHLALAMGATLPLALRGPVAVASAQTSLPLAGAAAFGEKMALLWNDDPVLGPALAAAGAGRMTAEGQGPRGDAADIALAKLAAARLAAPSGPRIAVLEQNGWDTHSAQANRVQRQAQGLAGMLAALADGLQDVWPQTAILAVSEFGRTVQPNGAGGTDHGTAGAAFLLGGALRGGRVLADWPGLRPAQMQDYRDLRPTLDLRSVYMGIAAGHFGLDAPAALAALCPDADGLRPAALFSA